MSPFVSIVMPVFNAEKFVARAIESIRAQTFTDFELLIVDDKSTDRSVEIIRQHLIDERIQLISNVSNLGAGLSINRGIDSARGEFIAIMHADDVSLSDRINRQLEFLKTKPKVGVVGSWAWAINEAGDRTRLLRQSTDSKKNAQLIWRQCPLIHSTVMFRRIALEEQRYSSSRVAEDYELWIELTKKGVGIVSIPLPLVEHRQHPAQTSNLKAQEELEACYQLFHRLYPGFNISLDEYKSLTFRTFELPLFSRARMLFSIRSYLRLSALFVLVDCIKYFLLARGGRFKR